MRLQWPKKCQYDEVLDIFVDKLWAPAYVYEGLKSQVKNTKLKTENYWEPVTRPFKIPVLLPVIHSFVGDWEIAH